MNTFSKVTTALVIALAMVATGTAYAGEGHKKHKKEKAAEAAAPAAPAAPAEKAAEKPAEKPAAAATKK